MLDSGRVDGSDHATHCRSRHWNGANVAGFPCLKERSDGKPRDIGSSRKALARRQHRKNTSWKSQTRPSLSKWCARTSLTDPRTAIDDQVGFGCVHCGALTDRLERDLRTDWKPEPRDERPVTQSSDHHPSETVHVGPPIFPPGTFPGSAAPRRPESLDAGERVQRAADDIAPLRYRSGRRFDFHRSGIGGDAIEDVARLWVGRRSGSTLGVENRETVP